MAKPYFHAQSSAKKYGGTWEDYMDIHNLIDSSKAAFPDNRHRVLTHNSWFIGHVLPLIFGETFTRKSDGKIVCSRDIGEQHVLEDYKMKFIPTPSDFISEMDFVGWMQNAQGEPPASHKKLEPDVSKKVTRVHTSYVEPKVNPTYTQLEIPFPEAGDPQQLEIPFPENGLTIDPNTGQMNIQFLPIRQDEHVIFDGRQFGSSMTLD